MLFDKLKNLNQSKPGLFSPSITRLIQEPSAASINFQVTAGEAISITDIESTSSFKYALPGKGMKSTQQLNVDWSKFQNHTFFNSAQVKTNVAFDKIINQYPFDGTLKENESYFDSLTGFEKWVYDQYPKNKGYLFFSGSSIVENGDVGTYVTVKDYAGNAYPSVSRLTTGQPILNPGIEPLSVEFYVYLPEQTNSASCIIDKHEENSSNKQGFYLGLQPNISSVYTSMSFFILSGTVSSSVTVGIEKGQWQHFAFVWDKTPGVYTIFSYKNGELYNSSSQQVEIDNISAIGNNLYIGSGSAITSVFTPVTTFSGALDELRIWHSIKNKNDIQQYMQKAIFADNDLKLYYKFNEPSGSNSALVIDYSSNSLHGKLNNAALTYKVREIATGSIAGSTPMLYEKDYYSPVLFPNYTEISDFRMELLVSGSSYDNDNPNLITKLIPPHYLLEGQEEAGLSTEQGQIVSTLKGGSDPRSVELGATQTFLLLLYTWAKFFDEMKLFIQAFSDLNFVDYDQTDTVPDQFLVQLAKSQGIDLPPLFTGASLNQFLNAENIQGDISTDQYSLQYIQNQIWRRILINLQDILQSKGTLHSVKAFIRSVGIDPDNNFRIREYGGPTKRNLSFIRENRNEISTALTFISGGLITSPFLTGSRIEPGLPLISNSTNDKLFTSGSWTYEATYILEKDILHNPSQSLFRLNTTGSTIATQQMFVNIVCVSGAKDIEPTLNAYIRPNTGISSPVLTLTLSGVDLFDGNQWYVSVGRNRNDLIGDGTVSLISSSYFLRTAKQNFGEILELKQTSSYFDDYSGGGFNIFQNFNSSWNSSGSFFTVGSQSIDTSLAYGLNNIATVGSTISSTEFNGKITQIRFWSKGLEESEWKEHVLDYRSVGVQNPENNFNFVTNTSGSWQRLRIDASTDQIYTASNGSGIMEIFDFSQNQLHLHGTNFDPYFETIIPERFFFSYISPRIDEASTVEKVRSRSYLNFENVISSPYAEVAPVYDVPRSELPTDNTKFTIDFSIVDTLNQDIITIFSTLDILNNILGNPELLYSPDYPGLENLRNIYFNKLTDKVNLKNFFEFFKWFDTNIGTFVAQLIPRKTKFLGTNFVIESHMIERPKMEYFSVDSYIGEANRIREPIIIR